MDFSKVKFDEKGLVPAVVQDGNGTVLMLAYMNEESLAKTLETGYTWFWSRSRQELWNKGGTSGHLQKVKEILYDCDGDTLLVKVDQTSVACHTGSYTCFDGRLLFKSEEEQLKQERDFVKNFLHLSSQENCVNTRREQQLMPPPTEHPVPVGARVYRLPEPDMLPDKEMNFLELIEVRGSIRQYSEKEITLQELSYLLWCTQGVKMVQPNGTTMRNVPSAGARHAFETYLLINRVEGIPSGIYRFLALGHALLPISTEQADIDKFIEGIKSRGLAKNSAVTFIWTADYQRMSYAFGNRAMRYVYLDAGHVCQNLYLAAYTMQIGTCALGAFYDDKLNEVLGLDGENDFVVYGASVGKPEL